MVVPSSAVTTMLKVFAPTFNANAGLGTPEVELLALIVKLALLSARFAVMLILSASTPSTVYAVVSGSKALFSVP